MWRFKANDYQVSPARAAAVGPISAEAITSVVDITAAATPVALADSFPTTTAATAAHAATAAAAPSIAAAAAARPVVWRARTSPLGGRVSGVWPGVSTAIIITSVVESTARAVPSSPFALAAAVRSFPAVPAAPAAAAASAAAAATVGPFIPGAAIVIPASGDRRASDATTPVLYGRAALVASVASAAGAPPPVLCRWPASTARALIRQRASDVACHSPLRRAAYPRPICDALPLRMRRRAALVASTAAAAAPTPSPRARRALRGRAASVVRVSVVVVAPTPVLCGWPLPASPSSARELITRRAAVVWPLSPPAPSPPCRPVDNALRPRRLHLAAGERGGAAGVTSAVTAYQTQAGGRHPVTR